MSDTQRYRFEAAIGVGLRIVLAAFPFLLGVSGWTFTEMSSLKSRVSVLESQQHTIYEDLREIKADVKQLLRGR